jgi:hyperosmotically inducible periplasmic protein
MRKSMIVGSLAFALAAWSPVAWAENYPADNTGKNARDANGNTMTSGDQSESKADLAISQAIRQKIVADKSLSTNAHNVKIITSGGVVTLRGPVNTAEEKAKISAAAQQVAGVKHVQNQLEIASQ